MLVWCTGVSGSERTEFLREAAEYINEDPNDRRRAEVFDVGQMLNAVPAHLRYSDNHTDLLDGNEDLLHLHRVSALSELKDQILHSCGLYAGRPTRIWHGHESIQTIICR